MASWNPEIAVKLRRARTVNPWEVVVNRGVVLAPEPGNTADLDAFVADLRAAVDAAARLNALESAAAR